MKSVKGLWKILPKTKQKTRAKKALVAQRIATPRRVQLAWESLQMCVQRTQTIYVQSQITAGGLSENLPLAGETFRKGCVEKKTSQILCDWFLFYSMIRLAEATYSISLVRIIFHKNVM